MRIVFMGTPLFSVPILESLIENYEVVLVVSQPDKKVGRNKVLTPTPIKEVAVKNNIECFQPFDIKSDYQRILDVNPDIIITAAYGQIIPTILLDTPKYKAINVHASLLPLLRGGAPIHKAIIEGHEYSGITIMYMAPKMDAGDIIVQEKILINDDNTTILTDRLSLLGRDLLSKTLPLIKEHKIKPVPQDEGKVSFARNISKEEERIIWDKTAKEVYNQIRGLSDVPGAYTIYNDKKVKMYQSTYELTNIEGKNGEIVVTDNKLGIKVKDGIIYPTIIQLEGKRKMSIKDFYNGMATYFKKGNVLW